LPSEEVKEEEGTIRLAIKLGRFKEYMTIVLCAGGTIYLGAIGVLDAQAVTGILGAIVGFVLGAESVRRRGET